MMQSNDAWSDAPFVEDEEEAVVYWSDKGMLEAQARRYRQLVRHCIYWRLAFLGFLAGTCVTLYQLIENLRNG